MDSKTAFAVESASSHASGEAIAGRVCQSCSGVRTIRCRRRDLVRKLSSRGPVCGPRDLLLNLSQACFVYIIANRSRNLYTGVTNNLERRLLEHREGLVPGFPKRYRIHRLVHYETFGDIRAAIAREKQIKGWDRKKRVALIEANNPTWADLAETLFAKQKQIPRSPRATS